MIERLQNFFNGSLSLNYIFKFSLKKGNSAWLPIVLLTIMPLSIIVAQPTVTTPTSTAITNNGATLGGNITNDGGSGIVESGVYWDTSPGVTTGSNMEIGASAATGVFSDAVTGFTPKTQIFFRAYATNATLTGLSTEATFYTLGNNPGAIATFTAGTITSTSIQLNWAASTNATGYLVYMSTGGTAPNPTLTDGAAPTGSPIATLGAVLTTTINPPLTRYTEYSFTIIPFDWDGGTDATYNYGTPNTLTSVYTLEELPVVTSPTVTAIASDGATLGGNVTDNGGNILTEKGTLWKISSTVTITDNKLAEGTTSTGVFTDARTGMPAKTQIFYAPYAINAIGTDIGPESSFYTLGNDPGTIATFTSPSQSATIDLAWTASANATGYLVYMSTGSTAPTPTLTDGAAPTGTPIANIGTLTHTANSLSSFTEYSFTVIPYDWDVGVDATYNFGPPKTLTSVFTTCDAPSVQASGVSLSNVQAGSMQINWTPGNGTGGTLIIARKDNPVNQTPVSNTSYTTDLDISNEGNADDLGGGNFAIYKGSSSPQTITGLDDNKPYYFAFYEFNTTDNCYQLTSAPTATATTISVNNTSTITNGSAPATISSIINSSANQVVVFNFTITDLGDDGADSDFTELRFTPGTGNEVADWSQVIADARLYNASTNPPWPSDDHGTAVITAAQIKIPNISVDHDDHLGDLHDGNSRSYKLILHLKSNLGSLKSSIDGKHFVFELNASGVTPRTGTYSGFNPATTTNSNADAGTNNEITVTASKLSYTTEPSTTASATIALAQQPILEARDANDNVDLDFSESLSVTTPDALLNPINAIASFTNGYADFTGSGFNLQNIGVSKIRITATPSALFANSAASITVTASTDVAQTTAGVAPSILDSDATNKALLGFSLTTTGSALNFTGGTITTSSDPDGKVKNLKLYRSIDNDYGTSGDNTLVAATITTPTPTSIAISGISEAINGTSSYFFIVADVESNVSSTVSSSLQLSIAAVNDITVNIGSRTGTPFAGNTYTFNDVTAPVAFTVGSVNPTGGRVVATYWNGTNTGVDVTVPIDNDATLMGGTLQIRGKISTDPFYSNISTPFAISTINTNKTVSLSATDFELIPNFAEGVTVQITAIIADKDANSTTGTLSSTTLFSDQVEPSVNGAIRVYTNSGQGTGDGNHEVILFFISEDITLNHNDVPKFNTTYGNTGFSVDDESIGEALYLNNGSTNAVDGSLTNDRLIYLESSDNGLDWSVAAGTNVQYVQSGTSGTGNFIRDIAGNELNAFTSTVTDGDVIKPFITPNVMTFYPRAGSPEKIVFTMSEQLDISAIDDITGFTTSPLNAVDIAASSYSDNGGIGPYTITLVSSANGNWTAGTTVSYTSGTGNIKDIAQNEMLTVVGHGLTVETEAPVITDVTIPNVPMNVGDIVPVTIIVENDDFDVPILTSGTIGGYPLQNFSGTGPTNYSATFTITEGGNNYLANVDIPVANLILTDLQGNASTAYNANISQANDLLDAVSPQISSILKASVTNIWSSTNGTSASSVEYTVTFSEPVSGVDITDFQLTTIGSLSGATVTNVSGSGTTYTVTVASYSNTGTLRLDFVDNGSVFDTPGGNPVVGPAAIPDGSYTSGDVYSIVLPQPTENIDELSVTTSSTNNSITINWNEPSSLPTHYLLIARTTSGGTFPAIGDGGFVNDDPDLSDGVGTKIILSGGGSPVSHTFNTGLTSGTDYSFELYVYNLASDNSNDNIDFKTDGTIPAFTKNTITAAETTLGVGSGAVQVSSTMDTDTEFVDVFTFTVNDDDNNPDDALFDDAIFNFNELLFTAGGSNTVTKWDEVIAGVRITDGTAIETELVGSGNLSITANTITFSDISSSNSGDIGYINDDASKTYTLSIFLKPDLSGTQNYPVTIDGLRLHFQIDENGFTYDDNPNLSSRIKGGEISESGTSNNEVAVIATQLDFTTPPDGTALVLTDLTTTPIVETRDENGNRDLDFGDTSESVIISNTDAISMAGTGLSGGTTLTGSNGVITFPADFQYLDQGDGTITVTNNVNGFTLTPTSPQAVAVSYDNNNTITAGPLDENLAGQISSLVNASPGVSVFDFIITDDAAGAGDGSPTRINQIVLTQGTGNSIADWTEAIAGATLSDGINTFTGVVNSSNLTFAAMPTTVGAIGYVDDGTPKTYTLNIWLHSALGGTLPADIDDLNFVFNITDDDPANITLDPLSSVFTGTETLNSGAANNEVEVIASQLVFTQQPPVEWLVNTDFSTSAPVVEAQDANLNRDLDYTESVSVVDNNTIPLNINNEPTVFANGIAQFATNFQYAEIGNAQLRISPTTFTFPEVAPLSAILSNTFLVRVAASTLITSTGGTAEPATIASTEDTNPGTFVFDFTIEDDAGTENDGNATLITDLVIAQGATFNDADLVDWTQVIEGAILYDDEGVPNSLTGTIGTNTITFSSLPTTTNALGYIGDDASKIYNLQIWLKDSIDFRISGFTFPMASYIEPTKTVDNKRLEFSIAQIGITTNINGSGIKSGESLTSGNANQITVDATELDFSIQPPASSSVNTTYPVRTEARDVNDNRDVDFNFNLSSDVTSNLALLNKPLSGETFVNGVFNFNPGFQYNEAGNSPEGNLTLVSNGKTALTHDIEVIASFDSYISVVDPGAINNINAIQFDAADIINDGSTSVEIGRFILHDGHSPLLGNIDDIDGAITNVTDLDISITGFANLKSIALYAEDIDGSGNGVGVFTEIDEQAAAATIDFEDAGSGLFHAEDNKIRTFIIVASYLDTYLDNDPIQVTITNVEARLGASQFNAAEPLPATDITKYITEVTATQLDFEAALDSEQGINIPITPAQPRVYANDLKNNLDLDFAETVVITTPGAGINTLPAKFSNVDPGILDFPGFNYSSIGDGKITVTAFNGLNVDSNPIDVIHTTFTTLDKGPGVTTTFSNNGIEATSAIVAGGSNKAILGFTVVSGQNTTNEPILKDITIRFGNPINPSLDSIRLVSSLDMNFQHPESTISQADIVGIDYVTFKNIDVSLDEVERHYFVIADILSTANFQTPAITPVLIADSSPDNFVADEDVILTKGSVDANITGRTYSFDDINNPVVISLNPVNGEETFSKDAIISIHFNEAVIPLDSVINVYSLATDTLVATLKVNPMLDPLYNVNPLLNNADSTEYYFDPQNPIFGSPLAGDTDYYINIEPGDTLALIGFMDISKNTFAGISGNNKWVFHTADEVPPVFVATDAVNIIDIGFDLRIALDEKGLVNYMILDINDADIGSRHPTALEVRNPNTTFGTSLVDGAVDILLGNELHYTSIFDNSLTPGNTYRVYMIGEDIAGNLMEDADVDSLDVTLTTGPYNTGVIVQTTPNSDSIDVCIGDYQLMLAPISIIEGQDGDFTAGDNTINFILPTEFEFRTDNATVIGQGDEISNVDFNFISNSILKISYTISSTSTNRDKIVIGGMEIKALGDTATIGAITRLGGNGIPTIADGDTLIVLNTTRIPTVTFTTVPNTTSIGDAILEVPLIPVLTPLDKGARVFSGPGVFGETFYTAAAGFGTHNITFNYTDERGCESEYSLFRSVFDSDEAIVGLNQVYCTDDAIGVIPFNGRAPGFFLVDLKVEVAPDQPVSVPAIDPIDPFLVDVTSSLVPSGNDYLFDPGTFRFQANFDKFTNTIAKTNEGGLLGELLFTSVYQNQQNTNLFDTLEQRVKVYFSPTSEISIAGGYQIGDNSFDPANTTPTLVYGAELEFCEDDLDIELEGSSPDGFFSVTIPHLGVADSVNFPGITDNRDGTGFFNPQTIVDNSDFSFGELIINFEINSPVSGCGNKVSQTIRINPKPRANFAVPAIICEDTELTFDETTFFLQEDQDSVNNSTNNAIMHPLTSWEWNFNDAANSTGTNPNTAVGANVVHKYIDPGLYDVRIDIADDYGCSADTTIELVIGGLPNASFTFGGVSKNETFTFKSSSTVTKSSASLDHAIDSVKWDVNSDGVFDIGSFDNNPLVNNENISYYDGSNFANSGMFDVTFVAISTTGCSDTLTQMIGVLPNDSIVSSTATYETQFKDDGAGWIALPNLDANGKLDTLNSWVWGAPQKPLVDNDDNNPNAWATNIAGSYQDGERSYIYSPALDITNLDRPMIQFDIKRDLEDQDGVIFEYSTDSKNIMDPLKEWKSLGAKDEGIEWFNAIGLAGSPGDDVTGLGWEGTSEEWVKAKHDLTEVYDGDPSLKSRVVFRFGLGAIASEKGKNGFAFDNVFIGNRTRTVLIENFTSMVGSTQNKTQNEAIYAQVSDPDGAELVVLNYHTSFDGPEILNSNNPSEPSARALYYGANKNPRVVIDGHTSTEVIGSDAPYSAWGKTFYSKRTLQISPFEIELVPSVIVNPDNPTIQNLGLSANLTATSNEITGNFIVHIAVVEDSISDADIGLAGAAPSGETVFYNTLRKMLPNASGTFFPGGLVNGASVSVDVEWSPTNVVNPTNQDIDPSRLNVIVFVQDELTREIHQAEMANLDDLTQNLVLSVKQELTDKGIALYPNPADKLLVVELAKSSIDEQRALIFDNTGKQVEEIRLNPGQTKIELNTTSYTPGIYLFALPNEEGAIMKRFIISH